MMESKNTFLGGKLNQDLDERLLKNGEYPYALNLRVINSDGSDAGAVENTKGAEQISSFSLTNAVTIGCFADESNNKMYWFTTSDEKDMVVEYNEELGSTVVLLESSKPNSLLNFSKEHLITGVVKIINGDSDKDLLAWTDDLNDPRLINITRAKTYAVDGFDKEDINLIKKPPLEAPATALTNTATAGNNIEDRFLAFATRYEYLDGEYSALSSFSNYTFSPNEFHLDPPTLDNDGMINAFNAVDLTFNTGDKRVVKIQVVFKEALSSTVYKIQDFIKDDKGWADNVEKTFRFSNNKNYSALPEDELFRTFDNVPRWAKALEIIENRLVFGNYVEGYDMVNLSGETIYPKYNITAENTGLVQEVLPTVLSDSGSTDNLITIDFTGVNLVKNALIVFRLDTEEITYSDGTFDESFSFVLNKSYADVTELALDTDFITFITTVWSTNFDTNKTGNIPAGTTYVSTTPFAIESSTATSLSLKHAEVVYDITATSPDLVTSFWEYLSTTQVLFREAGLGTSAKTNRDYEVGIIYMDDYSRKSTVITSEDNTVYINQRNSADQNVLVSSITSKPPYWADRYKYVVKQNKGDYETIYTSIVYNDGLYKWLKLEGNSKNKVKEGDTLIVKSDLDGRVSEVIEVEVLEVASQSKDFIDGNLDPLGNVIGELAGVYMKIKPSGFNLDAGVQTTFNHDGYYATKSGNAFVSFPRTGGSDFSNLGGLLQIYDEDTELFVDVPITATSKVHIKFHNFESDGDSEIYEKPFVVLDDYTDFQSWWEAEVINLGDQEVNFDWFFSRHPSGNNGLYLTVIGTSMTGTEFERSKLQCNIDITLSSGIAIFETKPEVSNDEVYYETSETLFIENGFHLGNVQDQTALQSEAISKIDFYNCFVQGNGAESLKHKDAFNHKSLQADLRPSTTSIEGYREIRRYADLTYSEAYNPNTSINGLNEFNLSRANFKEDLDKKYGSIQKLYARDTDLVVFQENKVSRVLFGKDLLMNADGSSNVSAIESILGQQVSYAGEYGISKNPESFAYDGSSLYFTDDNRGTILRLGLNGISEINQGLKTFYKDAFKEPYWTKKIGAFDPFFDQYVVSVDSETVIEDKELNLGDSLSLSNFTGSFVVTYNLPIQEGLVTIAYEANGQPIRYIFNYDGNITDTGFITTNGEHSFTKPEGVGTVTVTIDAQDCGTSLNLSSNIDYEDINVYLAVVNKESDIGKVLTIGYNWAKSGFSGGGREISVMLTENAVPEYKEIFSGNITGLGKGIAEFPADSSVITMYAVQDYNADEVFTVGNEMGVEEDATVLAASVTMESGDFTSIINTEELIDGRIKHSTLVSNTDELGNIYLLWNLRSEYLNVQITGSVRKDDCGVGEIGESIPFLVPAGMFSSGISQADADAQAQAYFDANVQSNANANGVCFIIPGGGGGDLVINSSVPLNDAGTLDFYDGESSEIINLSFEFTYTVSGAINFGQGITVGSIDTLHTYREGTAQLDASGSLSSFSYSINSGCTCRITIIGRSSAEPIPASDSTLIDNL